MEISSKIDYVTLTTTSVRYKSLLTNSVASVMEAADVIRWVLPDFGLRRVVLETEPAARGYNYGFKTHTEGIECSVSSRLDEQGIMVRISGKALSEMNDARMWILHAIDRGWRTTRVDVAFDVYDGGIPVDVIASAYMSHAMEENKRKSTFIQGPKGSTLYIGSRMSEKMLRVYDKGLQQGTFLDWVRVELEIKGQFCHLWGQDAIRNPNEFAPLVAKMLEPGSVTLSNAIGEMAAGIHEAIREVPRTATNRGLWFHTTVLSAFEGLLRDDRAAAVSFIARIHELVDAGVSEPQTPINS